MKNVQFWYFLILIVCAACPKLSYDMPTRLVLDNFSIGASKCSACIALDEKKQIENHEKQVQNEKACNIRKELYASQFHIPCEGIHVLQ